MLSGIASDRCVHLQSDEELHYCVLCFHGGITNLSADSLTPDQTEQTNLDYKYLYKHKYYFHIYMYVCIQDYTNVLYILYTVAECNVNTPRQYYMQK